jgi:hypothetical protein
VTMTGTVTVTMTIAGGSGESGLRWETDKTVGLGLGGNAGDSAGGY